MSVYYQVSIDDVVIHDIIGCCLKQAAAKRYISTAQLYRVNRRSSAAVCARACRDVSCVAWSRDVARGDDVDVMFVARRPHYGSVADRGSPATARRRFCFR